MSAETAPTVTLDAPPPPRAHKASLSSRLWAWSWPKLFAIALALGIWQFVVWTGVKPEFVLPGPATVFAELWQMMQTQTFWYAIATTMRRAATGFLVALLIGSLIGVAVARVRPLRMAVGSLITGLQTMPSIVWFPFAILLFQITETAIFFVVVLGAAPSIANGVIAGIDYIPPQFLRLGKVLGARGFSLYRFIIVPAILPSYVAGLNQGWSFAWRSLMAGEILVVIAARPSLGSTLEFARQFSQAPRLLATMITILIIGMLVDGVFSMLSRRLRERRGLAIDD